jgi:hypothetical protein
MVLCHASRGRIADEDVMSQVPLRVLALVSLLLLLGPGCTQENGAFFSSIGAAAVDGTGEAGTTTTTTTTSTSISDGDGDGDGDAGDGGNTASSATRTDSSDSHDTTVSSPTEGESTSDEAEVKLVFVTSEAFTGAELGGLDGADEKCQALAADAGLAGSFQAWLSDGTGSPSERMNRSGRWELLDGRLVATDWEALVSGTLENAIDVTEGPEPKGIEQVCSGGEVWTNTNVDGTPRGDLHCNDWSTDQGVSFVGYSWASGPAWTDSPCINVHCVSELRLYCFQQ